MRILVAVGIVAGAVERVVVWRLHVGALDGDEAVWGLMARHIADGHFTAFMWGQAYGGTLEALLSAPLLAVFPGSVVALRAVPTALTALAAVLVWRVGLRTIDPRAAAVAGVLFWVWPSYSIWKSMRAHGFYGAGVVAALLVLLLVLRLSERSTKTDAAALGLVVGVGLWQSAQLLPIAVVATVWLIWRKPEALRLAPLALGCAFLGFLPWTISNLRHDWWSFSFPPAAGTFASRLRGSLNGALPMVFGLAGPVRRELGRRHRDRGHGDGRALRRLRRRRGQEAQDERQPARGRGARVSLDRRNVDVHLDRRRAALPLHRLARAGAARLAGSDDVAACRSGAVRSRSP